MKFGVGGRLPPADIVVVGPRREVTVVVVTAAVETIAVVVLSVVLVLVVVGCVVAIVRVAVGIGISHTGIPALLSTHPTPGATQKVLRNIPIRS